MRTTPAAVLAAAVLAVAGGCSMTYIPLDLDGRCECEACPATADDAGDDAPADVAEALDDAGDGGDVDADDG